MSSADSGLPNDQTVLLNLRWEQALEAFTDATFLFNSAKGYRTVVNRAYYSCFYAALAILQTQGRNPRTHKGVQIILGRDFVQSGKLTQEALHGIRTRYLLRQADDYQRITPVLREEAARALELCEAFLRQAGNFLRQLGLSTLEEEGFAAWRP
jgi:uncharacterized protein (UPF0332 family)